MGSLGVVVGVWLVIRIAGSQRLLSGQVLCRRGEAGPCYKVAYLAEASRRVGWREARRACEAEGGDLASVESAHEQRVVEALVSGVAGGADGDFWIGLRREDGGARSRRGGGLGGGLVAACEDLYAWSDGSRASYRKWYADEPSCGSEVCVVMYHQPTAAEGFGGPYMYTWNDDRCNMKHNFICKYGGGGGNGTAASTATTPAPNASDIAPTPLAPPGPPDPNFAADGFGSVHHLLFVAIPAVPLALILLIASGLLCARIFSQWRRKGPHQSHTPHLASLWLSPARSPSPDIHGVIRDQATAAAAAFGAPPDVSSFRRRSESLGPSVEGGGGGGGGAGGGGSSSSSNSSSNSSSSSISGRYDNIKCGVRETAVI
ncbi:chondrolectin-like [Lampetra fluviatilis]